MVTREGTKEQLGCWEEEEEEEELEAEELADDCVTIPECPPTAAPVDGSSSNE